MKEFEFKDIPSTVFDIQQGNLSSETLLRQVFCNIESPDKQGTVTILRTFEESAFTQARKIDTLIGRNKRNRKNNFPGLAGIPFTIKDNFDIAGLPNQAGSLVLQNSKPARCNAPLINLLENLGAVLVGQTNMTEFAYSGLGLNRHFGNPLSPSGRRQEVISGGSTSGGAVALAENMCLFSVGTDTSGSCRIPAACCGLVGYKPSKGKLSEEGIIPLAPSLDVPGLLTKQVIDLKFVVSALEEKNQLLTKQHSSPATVELTKLRVLVPTEIIDDDFDIETRTFFDEFKKQLVDLGIHIDHKKFLFEEIANQLKPADLVAYEAYQFHKDLLSQHSKYYDERISMRMSNAKNLSREYYEELIKTMNQLRNIADQLLSDYDVIVLPTLPIVPPRLSELEDNANYLKFNALMIKHTAIANHLDLPAIVFPIAPVLSTNTPASIQLIGKRSRDNELLLLAEVLENELAKISNH